MVFIKDYYVFSILYIIKRFRCIVNEICIFVVFKIVFGFLYRDYVFIKFVEVIGVLVVVFFL